jgi:hypothetical protein
VSFEYRQQDRDILVAMAEYRVLPVRHLRLLRRRNDRALRRRLRRLQDEGLIRTSTSGLGRGRGRPEQVLSLTPAGVDRLKADGVLAAELQPERVTIEGLGSIDHQILLNEFRLQVAQVPEIISGLAVHVAGVCCARDVHLARQVAPLRERVPASDDLAGHNVAFTPDEVFCLADAKSEKAVLFFLEVDMGSESLSSPKGTGKDVRQKVANYQAFFRGQQYKRYEQLWGAAFRGFRLLFLASSTPRLTDLCQLVKRTPPSDFIWLTDQESMLSKGIWSPIWIRGGRYDGPLHSILGSRAQSPGPSPAELA